MMANLTADELTHKKQDLRGLDLSLSSRMILLSVQSSCTIGGGYLCFTCSISLGYLSSN